MSSVDIKRQMQVALGDLGSVRAVSVRSMQGGSVIEARVRLKGDAADLTFSRIVDRGASEIDQVDSMVSGMLDARKMKRPQRQSIDLGRTEAPEKARFAFEGTR